MWAQKLVVVYNGGPRGVKAASVARRAVFARWRGCGGAAWARSSAAATRGSAAR